jgi:hypothetical protein
LRSSSRCLAATSCSSFRSSRLPDAIAVGVSLSKVPPVYKASRRVRPEQSHIEFATIGVTFKSKLLPVDGYAEAKFVNSHYPQLAFGCPLAVQFLKNAKTPKLTDRAKSCETDGRTKRHPHDPKRTDNPSSRRADVWSRSPTPSNEPRHSERLPGTKRCLTPLQRRNQPI